MPNIIKIIVFAFIAVYTLGATAQRSVFIESNFNDYEKAYKFSATNNSQKTHTVILTIEGMRNLGASNRSPFVFEVKPNVTRADVLSLKVTDPTQAFGFDTYKWTYYTGCMNPRIEPSIQYILPVADNKKVRISYVTYLGSIFGKNEPENWNVYTFKTTPGDTIFASRRGRVVDIEENHEDHTAQKGEFRFFDSQENTIILEHEDCSYGKYSRLTINGILPEVGEFVEVGSPLGIAGERLPIFSVYTYVNKDMKHKEKSEPYHIPIVFATKEAESVSLRDGSTYLHFNTLRRIHYSGNEQARDKKVEGYQY